MRECTACSVPKAELPAAFEFGSSKLLRLDAAEFWDEFCREDSCVGDGCFASDWGGWARFSGWSLKNISY